MIGFFKKNTHTKESNRQNEFMVKINGIPRTVTVHDGKISFFLEKEGEEDFFIKKLTLGEKLECIQSFAISPHHDTKKVTLFVENSSFTKSNELEELLKQLNLSSRKNR